MEEPIAPSPIAKAATFLEGIVEKSRSHDAALMELREKVAGCTVGIAEGVIAKDKLSTSLQETAAAVQNLTGAFEDFKVTVSKHDDLSQQSLKDVSDSMIKNQLDIASLLVLKSDVKDMKETQEKLDLTNKHMLGELQQTYTDINSKVAVVEEKLEAARQERAQELSALATISDEQTELMQSKINELTNLLLAEKRKNEALEAMLLRSIANAKDQDKRSLDLHTRLAALEQGKPLTMMSSDQLDQALLRRKMVENAIATEQKAMDGMLDTLGEIKKNVAASAPSSVQGVERMHSVRAELQERLGRPLVSTVGSTSASAATTFGTTSTLSPVASSPSVLPSPTLLARKGAVDEAPSTPSSVTTRPIGM